MKKNKTSVINYIAALTAVLLAFTLAGLLLSCGNAGPSSGKAGRADVVPVIRNEAGRISVCQRSFYPDGRKLLDMITDIRASLEDGSGDAEYTVSGIESAMREMERLGYYYDYAGTAFVTGSDGTVYGAGADASGPVGGGEGCEGVSGRYTFRVYDDNSFFDAYERSKPGDIIYIAGDAVIDLTDMTIVEHPDIALKEGVTVTSDRGRDGSRGGILRFTCDIPVMLRLTDGVRLFGLVIEGSGPAAHGTGGDLILTSGIVCEGDNIRIDNCEISGFNYHGIVCSSGSAEIDHCYIHDIKGTPDSSGILVEGGEAVISYNLFSNCSDCVSAESGADVSFTGSNNIEAGTSSGAMFRIAASAPDGTEKKGGCSAEILNNTVLGYTPLASMEGTPARLVMKYNLSSLNEDQYREDLLYGPADLRDGSGNGAEIAYNAFNITDPYLSSVSESGIPGPAVLTAPVTEERPSAFTGSDPSAAPDITFNVWCGDLDKVYSFLKTARSSNNRSGYLSEAFRELGSFSRYYKFRDCLSREIYGKVYGAYTEEGASPIGGGYGTTDILTGGDYYVKDLEGLAKALAEAKSGEVIFIDPEAVIDITDHSENGISLTVNEGVILASDRGRARDDGSVSTGALIINASVSSDPIYACANSRITGITLDGRNYGDHDAHHQRSFRVEDSPGSSYYYSLPIVCTEGINVCGDGAEIDNCELAGFGAAAVMISSGCRDIYVHHCYIHHNQTNGLGYGVCHGGNSTSVIEYNLFNFNRHSIAATGTPVTGYIARYNIEMGNSLEHCFDIHGGADRGDGTDIAGTYCEMYNNTFLNDNEPYWLRGVPEDHQYFFRNICYRPYLSYNVSHLQGENVEIYDNLFGIPDLTLVE